MLDAIRHMMETLKAKWNDLPSGKGSSVGDVDAALAPIQKELQDALDQLKKIAEDKDKPVHASTLRPIRETLGHVDSLFHEGKFTLPGVEGVPAGQAVLAGMLSDAHEQLRAVLESQVDFYKVAPELRPYHDKLENIQHALDSVKDKADLHPKDLRPYRSKLAEIDAHYEQGRFEVDHQFPEGQAIVAGMLNQAHETVRALLMKTDYYKVDPALYSVHDRLESIIMRLEGLMHKENVTEKDLGRLREKLQAVDAEYKDGKIAVGGQVPEGQAVISELLTQAHDLMAKVQNKMQG